MTARLFERGVVERAIEGLDPGWLGEQRWFGRKGAAISGLRFAHAFALDERSVLAFVDVSFGNGSRSRISLPFVADRDGPETAPELRAAEPGDGAWRALAAAAFDGRVIPAITPDIGSSATAGPPPTTSAVLVCRPAGRARSLLDLETERPLGVDQSNTSVVLGERIVLKAFRAIEPGLEPDLELTAFLSEEAAFGAVPPLAGSVELVTASDGVATVALLTEFVPDAEDGYETTAEMLTGWLLAPGSVAVEFATEDAQDLGLLTAALHGALLSRPRIEGFELRPASRDELRRWRVDAETGLGRAIEVSEGYVRERLREAAPAISARFTVYEALAESPLVARIHGDYHLGQVMRTADGWRIIDFEGEPTRSLDERRRHASPLRDVASMLRSLHHIGLSAAQRAEERHGGPLASTGLDLDGWLLRSRERFLAAYRSGLRAAGAEVAVDEDLLLAFELEKACYEFVYAATYLPGWATIAIGGLDGLLAWSVDRGR
mgnify:CR=1 FL=1